MLSIWEKQSFTTYDYIIIGSGIVGLSAAASLAEQYPDASIIVLERGIFPTGASTKNAGFACFGSVTELLSDFQKMTPEATVALVNERWQGLLQLRRRLGDEAIGFQQNGGYELISDKESYCLDKLGEINDLLAPVFNAPVFELTPHRLADLGFDSSYVKNLVFSPFEGQIDTGMMMRSLLRHVQRAGVTVLTGCEADQFEDTASGAEVHIKNFQGHGITLKGRKLAICTNAFTARLIPGIEIDPGRGQVLVTAPIKNLRFKGVFHFDEGYYYFRNYGNRILFGGGRNLDFEGEKTTEINTTQRIISDLEQKLRTIIIPGQEAEIEHRWAGIMAFGSTKQPIIRSHSANVVLGVRMGGMGVAIGTRAGARIAELMNE